MSISLVSNGDVSLGQVATNAGYFAAAMFVDSLAKGTELLKFFSSGYSENLPLLKEELLIAVEKSEGTTKDVLQNLQKLVNKASKFVLATGN
jgi:hypothetical protein